MGVLSLMKGRHVFPEESVIGGDGFPMPFCWVILSKSFLCLGQAGPWPDVFLATLKYWARERSRGPLFSLAVFLCVHMGIRMCACGFM